MPPPATPGTAPGPALPPSARAISGAVTDAVAAARAEDPVAFDEAAGRLAALDPAQVSVLLGAVVRSLLEDAHPAGLSGDDLRDVLEQCTRSAGWASGVEPGVLVVVLTGALGMQDPDDPPAHPAAVGRHAVLLTAHLLGTHRPAAAGRPLADHLAAAVAELARAQTIEMP